MMLKNKIAVITGSCRGIGLGIAQAMAREHCNIVIADINQKDCDKTAKDIEKMGVASLGVACDVSDKEQVDNLFSRAKEKFGQVDILVNNAGIFPFVAFEKMTESDWDKVINVNLKSVFLCSQAALKVMPDQGRIVNVSSIAAFVGFEGLTHYCASKGGINAMIRALALEVAERKITVNAVAPGAIDTPGAKSTEKVKQQTVAAIPLSRMGLPEDIANAAVFLASEKASYITGQTIIVDGGWTLR